MIHSQTIIVYTKALSLFVSFIYVFLTLNRILAFYTNMVFLNKPIWLSIWNKIKENKYLICILLLLKYPL